MKTKILEELQGAIEHYDERDYILGNENLFFIDWENPYRMMPPGYNQAFEPCYWWCIVFATMAVLGYNTGYRFRQEEVAEICKKAVEAWVVVPGEWWYFDVVTQFVLNYMKENYWFKIVKFRIAKGEELIKWLDNGWAFVSWRYTSYEYWKDTQDDGILNGCQFPKKTGHAEMLFKKWDKYIIRNSYEWTYKYNEYTLKQFQCWLNEWPTFKYFYTILPMEEQLQHNKDIEMIKRALEQKITNDKTLLEAIEKWDYNQKVQTVLMIARAVKPLYDKQQ